MFFLFTVLVPVFTITFEYFPSTKTGPTERTQAAIEINSNKSLVIVFGGQDLGGCSSELSIFDLQEEEWLNFKTDSLVPLGRHSMASMIVACGIFFYAIGGFTVNGPNNEVWRFSFEDLNVI